MAVAVWAVAVPAPVGRCDVMLDVACGVPSSAIARAGLLHVSGESSMRIQWDWDWRGIDCRAPSSTHEAGRVRDGGPRKRESSTRLYLSKQVRLYGCCSDSHKHGTRYRQLAHCCIVFGAGVAVTVSALESRMAPSGADTLSPSTCGG